jgi:hypothetical protein
MAFVKAKRLGLRWPAADFSKKSVTPTSFRKKQRCILYEDALPKRCNLEQKHGPGWVGANPRVK